MSTPSSSVPSNDDQDEQLKQLVDEMMEWVNGHKSHNNNIVTYSSPLDAGQVTALIIQADALEVQKRSAAIVALVAVRRMS